MKEVAGIWLPDHERHLEPFLNDTAKWVNGKGTYQLKKLLAAMELVTCNEVAVDVGAHVGLWSMQLARRFSTVRAFEPVEVHRLCWLRNVPPAAVLELWPVALGSEPGACSIEVTKGSSGDAWIADGEDTPVARYDDLPFGAGRVGFVKLDCEGYELLALRGMAEMLERDRPVVVVEQKPGKEQRFGLPETEAVGWLEGLGAKVRVEMSGDFILTW